MTSGATLRWVLPVSRRTAALRQPTGRDEMMLMEERGSEPARAIAFADRLADGGLDAAALPAPDLDALLLRLRQSLIGDQVLAETRCVAPSCRARAHIAFGIEAYLAHHAPRAPRRRRLRVARTSDASGWFALHGSDKVTRFRLPTAGDERDVAGQPNAAAMLADRCLEPAPCPAQVRRAAEAAMAALAPSLAGPLAGTCPECGREVAVQFDPRRYVLAELRVRAGFVAAEVDALAARYHWTERAILSLPSARRAAYAGMARRAA
jgi:hypothetical protein